MHLIVFVWQDFFLCQRICSWNTKTVCFVFALVFLTFTGLRLDPRNRRILPLYSQLHRGISRRNSGTPEGIWGIQSTCQSKQSDFILIMPSALVSIYGPASMPSISVIIFSWFYSRSLKILALKINDFRELLARHRHRKEVFSFG